MQYWDNIQAILEEDSPPRLQMNQVWRDCVSVLSGIQKAFSHGNNLSYHDLDQPQKSPKFL